MAHFLKQGSLLEIAKPVCQFLNKQLYNVIIICFSSRIEVYVLSFIGGKCVFYILIFTNIVLCNILPGSASFYGDLL